MQGTGLNSLTDLGLKKWVLSSVFVIFNLYPHEPVMFLPLPSCPERVCYIPSINFMPRRGSKGRSVAEKGLQRLAPKMQAFYKQDGTGLMIYCYPMSLHSHDLSCTRSAQDEGNAPLRRCRVLVVPLRG